MKPSTPIPKQRDIEINSSTQLLRAGTRPQDEEHQLLRAAGGGNEHEPDILLRAEGAEQEQV